MRLAPRRLLTVGVLGLVLLAGTAPAAAQDPTEFGRIVKINAEDGEISVVFQANVRDAASLDPASVHALLDDQELDVSVKRPDEANRPIRRQALLILDTSDSMTTEKLTAAKDAAEAFLEVVPADVEVGLMTFASKPTLRVSPTLDRAAVHDAVQDIESGGGTALYDAIVGAVETLDDADVGNLVLLSDGGNFARTSTSLDQAVASLERSQLGLTAMNFADSESDAAVLKQLADAGSGPLVQTTQIDNLSAAFEESALAIAAQLLITAPVPEGSQEGQYTVTVDAQAGDTTLHDKSVLTLDADDVAAAAGTPAIVPVHTGDGLFASQTVLIAAAILLFLGLSIILTYALAAGAANRREAEVRRRVAHYSLANVRATDITLAGVSLEDESALDRLSTASSGRSHGATTILGESGLARTAVELAERVVATRDSEGRLAARLEAAAIPLRAAEWLVLHTAAAVIPALALLLITGGDFALALLGLLIGAVGPYVYLSFKRSGRRHKFEEQLPGTLQLLAGSLSAGYSLPQAVDTVARESAQPVASEFGRAIMESRLAVPVEDALGHVAERTGSQDFSWVVMAIRIQRQVGGNLAELLTTIAGTLRERERLRRQVRVLSAEGRMSAYILGLMPLIFTMYLFVVRRDYLLKLFAEPLGIVMVFGGIIALLVGLFWMKKIVDVEV